MDFIDKLTALILELTIARHQGFTLTMVMLHFIFINTDFMDYKPMLIFSLFCLVSCKTPQYTHFSLRTSLWKNTGEVKTNGYYYCDLREVQGFSLKSNSEPLFKVFLLFTDGNFCRLDEVFNTHEQILKYLEAHKTDLGDKDKYANWGRYKIEAGKIFIEFFFFNPVQQHLGIYRNLGIVHSQIFFTIEKSFMVKDDPIRTNNKSYAYHFMPFSQTVDSTNWMMKKSWYKIN